MNVNALYIHFQIPNSHKLQSKKRFQHISKMIVTSKPFALQPHLYFLALLYLCQSHIKGWEIRRRYTSEPCT